jgi:tetrahydromethanopterin S-methyltransferase subunit G
MIEQETKENPGVKEELIKEVKGIEEELKNNDFEKIKQRLSKLKEKAKFLFPVLQQIVVEVFKNWVGI